MWATQLEMPMCENVSELYSSRFELIGVTNKETGWKSLL